jgi:ankyrin repeat protein
MDPAARASAEVLDRVKAAFHADDANQVRELLGEHPELRALLNQPIGPFDSPPITGVKSEAMLDVLLDAGADINAKSRWWAGGFGLLHCAPPELANYAIARGATVDAHAAARLGLLDRLRELVTADPALVHARGGDGQTPLHFASTVPVAEFLLDHGADINALDVDHESTPAQYMSADRQDVARYLVSRSCRSDLLLACTLGDLALAKQHLKADPACVRMRVSREYFPIINPKSGGTIYQWTLGFYISAQGVAKKFGHAELVRFLDEQSPAPLRLVEACWSGDAERVQAVLREHPNAIKELTDADKCQVAHAARNNELRAVQLMLQSGFPVDGTSQHHATALHWAGFHGNREMVEELLARGASLEALDADFHATPLGWVTHGSENGWYVRSGDYAGCADAMLRAGAKLPAMDSGSAPVKAVLEKWRRGSAG